MGDVSDTRKQILQNTLTDELKKHFRIVPQEKYEQVLEQVFEELEYEECTEDQCIMRVQELLQVENVFNLQVIGEGKDTQLNLKWITLDEKRNEEDYCRSCGTFELREMIGGLVEKLVGEKKVEPVVVVEKRKIVVVEKKEMKVINFSNGEYIGEVKYGEPNGQGTFTYSNGNKYEGEFKDGKPNGQGTKTWTSGGKYVGEFKNGEQNGKGTFTFPDGTKYVGEYKNGERNGQGTYTFRDGRKYVGEFKDGERWNGTLYDKYGNIRYKWVNGKPNGQGTKTVVQKIQNGVLFKRYVNNKYGWYEKDGGNNRGRYEGEIENLKPNGQGTFTNNTGHKYVGEWKDGKRWNITWYDRDGYIQGKYVNGEIN